MPKLVKPPTLRFNQRFIGIDPGQSGGIAILDRYSDNAQLIVNHFPMPSTLYETASLVKEWIICNEYTSCRVAIEKVHSRPATGKDGATVQGIASTFKFGFNTGALHGMLALLGVPVEEVPPLIWMKGLAIHSGKKQQGSKAEWKEALRVRAQQLFPALPIWTEKRTLGKQRAICDALLIAEYCRRKLEIRR